MNASPEPQNSVPDTLIVPPQPAPTVPMVPARKQHSTFIKFIRIFLFVLIIIGIGLLCTQSLWVPSLVNLILGSEQTTPLTASETPGTANVAVQQSATTQQSSEAPAPTSSASLLEATPHVDSVFGFSIRFPQGWTVTQRDNPLLAYSVAPPDNGLKFIVAVWTLPTSDGYTNDLDQDLKKDLSRFQFTSQKTTKLTIDGEDARLFVGQGASDASDLIELLVVHNGSLYRATSAYDPSYRDTDGAAILESVQTLSFSQ